MATQTQQIFDDSSVAISSTAPSTGSAKKEPMSMLELATALGAVQQMFGHLQIELCDSQFITDGEGHKTTIQAFVTEATDKAMDKELHNQIDAINKAKHANRVAQIFLKITAALTMVAGLLAVPLTGGTSAVAVLGALTSVISSSMSLAGKQDPIQMATEQLGEAMGSKIAADFLMTFALATVLTGGVSLTQRCIEGAGEAAAQGAAQAAQQGAASMTKWIFAEQLSSTFMQTGTPFDIAQLAKGNDAANYALIAILAALSLAGSVYSGSKIITQCQGRDLFNSVLRGYEINPAVFKNQLLWLQRGFQAAEIGANLTGDALWIEGQKAGCNAKNAQADMDGLTAQNGWINNSSSAFNENTMQIVNQIADAIRSITRASNWENEALQKV